MSTQNEPIRGRGSSHNPANRFTDKTVSSFEYFDEPLPAPKLQVNADHAKTVISKNDSPDVGFDYSLNPYRGCEHGCSYCYARPTHEYLGLSAGIDFETRIFAKYDAGKILRETLADTKWKPAPLILSSVTDPYQPIEQRLGITRDCLQVLNETRHPVGVITKNHGITRDVDLLADLASDNLCRVTISVTTLDSDLVGKLEPRTSRPNRRLEAIRKLSEAGIPVNVNVAPVIPGLNDHEIPSILEAASQAGASTAAYIVLRLPWAVNPLFLDWLDTHLPDRKDKILNRVRDLRDGKLNNTNFGERMKGSGHWADLYRTSFYAHCNRYGLGKPDLNMNNELFKRPTGPQLTLF